MVTVMNEIPVPPEIPEALEAFAFNMERAFIWTLRVIFGSISGRI